MEAYDAHSDKEHCQESEQVPTLTIIYHYCCYSPCPLPDYSSSHMLTRNRFIRYFEGSY